MVDLLSSVQRSNRFNSMNYKAVSIDQMLPKTGFNKYSVQYADDWIRTDKIAKSVLATQKAISVQAKKTEIIPEETESDLMGIKSILQAMSTQLQKLNQSASELAKNVEKGKEGGGDEGDPQKKKRNKARELTPAEEKIQELSSRILAPYNFENMVALSTNVAQITTRLDQMNDGMQSTDLLTQKIFASANRASVPFMETANAIADMGAVAGTAFKSNDEMIAFVEQANKQFAIGGASDQARSGAMDTMIQAMSAGTFGVGEMNAVLSAAPGIAAAIEESMGWAAGSVANYAEQGMVSADVVKNALLGMAGETNEKFASIPMTFGQVVDLVKNILLRTFGLVKTKRAVFKNRMHLINCIAI